MLDSFDDPNEFYYDPFEYNDMDDDGYNECDWSDADTEFDYVEGV